jgi:sugar diacid utilization regulator
VSRVLHRADVLGDLASQRAEEAVRLLLSDLPDARERAAKELLEDGVLADDGPVTALVVQPAGSALEQALVQTRRWHGARSALHLVRRDHGVLLLSGEGDARPVAEHLAGRRLPGTTRTVIGVGEPYPRLADAIGSYQEALRTARVAARLPSLGEVVCWSALGVYRVLSMVDEQRLDVRAVHPGLLRLLRTDGGQVLVETLETYLDLAGNAHATAERLQLHRTTLYYRLQRVEQLAGTNLKDGNERLCLHLALKMAHLADQR